MGLPTRRMDRAVTPIGGMPPEDTLARNPMANPPQNSGSSDSAWKAGQQAYNSLNRTLGVDDKHDIAGQFAKGNYGRGLLNLAYGAPGWAAMGKLFSGPKNSYMGGNIDEYRANRDQYETGIMAGAGQAQYGQDVAMAGASMAGQISDQAGRNAAQAGKLYSHGLAAGRAGMGRQDMALGQLQATAGRDIGSQALAQQQMANDRVAAQMRAQAATARGGNQAAAMRSAQAQASANALANNQQLGLLRLKEAESQRDAQMLAQQSAASAYGNRAQLGFGTAGQGLGASNQAGQLGLGAANSVAGIGGAIMDSGDTTTGQFLGAETALNKGQLDADMEHQEAKQKHKGGIIGAVGKIAGSIFGMGGGGGGLF